MARASTCRYVLTDSVGSAAATLCHRFGDLAHVDEDEHADHLGARTDQGGGEALDGRSARDCVVDQQHPPARDLGASYRWFVDLVTAVPGLADEGERQP